MVTKKSDDFATSWDNPPSFQGSISSENRDFTRPRESFYSSTVPSDLNSATDTDPLGNYALMLEPEVKSKPDPFVSQLQAFLKNSPLGVSYSGPIDGLVSPALISAVTNLQNIINNKTGKSINIISGSTVNPGAFAEALVSFAQLSASQTPQTTGVVKSFQSFFSQNNPVIGKLYSGPIDGNVNPQLIAAAQKAETLISSAINNKKVIGTIWNNGSKTFNTTIDDVSNAIKLILKSQNKPK